MQIEVFPPGIEWNLGIYKKVSLRALLFQVLPMPTQLGTLLVGDKKLEEHFTLMLYIHISSKRVRARRIV